MQGRPFVLLGVNADGDRAGIRRVIKDKQLNWRSFWDGGDNVKVTSARGAAYIAKAMVTKRIKPMTIDGKKVYQIGIPIHQGYRGIQEDKGENSRTIVNLLSPTVTDPNAYTPEFKGFLVKLEKA